MSHLTRSHTVVIVALLFLIVTTFAAVAVRAAEEEATKPNVLFVVSDDLNNDLGCYGHPLVKSPNTDKLAQRGVRFDRAYCQYPVCNPSRSSFLTGLYPRQTGVLTNKDHFRDRLPDVVTLPQLFQEHGYAVARIGKIFHYGVPNQIGTDGEDDPASWQKVYNPRGIDREIHDRIHSLKPGQFGATLSWLKVESQDIEHTDGIGATQAIEYLETHNPHRTGKPFFLAVGFYRPHTPYVAPSAYFDLYSRDEITPVLEKPGDRDDIPVAALADKPKQRELTLDQRREIIQAYYASISFVDAQLGRVLDCLDRLDLSDSTIVVFTSDHGYHLGEHGLWQKSNLFEGATRVPLVIAVPGAKNAGESTKAITELVDLYPTLAELCELPQPDHLVGQSLVPVLEDVSRTGKEAAWTVARSRAWIMHPEVGKRKIMGSTIRTPRYRYTEWNDGRDGVELYDYQQDPDEYTNLAHDPQHAETVEQLKALLQRVENRAE